MPSLINVEKRMLDFIDGLPVEIVGSMLRLGRKYAIAHIENRALRALHHDYPTTLRDWDSLSLGRRQIKHVDERTPSEVIYIAHYFDLFTILPAAYVKYLEDHILVGSFSRKTLWFLIIFLEQKTIPNVDDISEDDRDHILIGYARILEFVKERGFDALCPPLILPSEACSSRHKCEANKWKTIKDLPVWVTKEPNQIGIVGPNYPKVTENLCSQCQTAAIKLTDEVRSEFWSMLPTFFGLPAWKDLKDKI
jgi:hypothetical protein